MACHLNGSRNILHERSNLLEKGDLSRQERQTLAQAIMQEEDDWLGWKSGERDVGILDRITPGGYTLTSLALELDDSLIL